MTLVRASIDIDAPRERVYDFMLDPANLDEWVTIHRRVNSRDAGPPREGFEMNQTPVPARRQLQGPLDADRGRPADRATWEGRGPAHSYARTSYALAAPTAARTRFEYENEFKAPGGFLGAAASRMLIGGLPEREARRTLSGSRRCSRTGDGPRPERQCAVEPADTAELTSRCSRRAPIASQWKRSCAKDRARHVHW